MSIIRKKGQMTLLLISNFLDTEKEQIWEFQKIRDVYTVTLLVLLNILIAHIQIII